MADGQPLLKKTKRQPQQQTDGPQPTALLPAAASPASFYQRGSWKRETAQSQRINHAWQAKLEALRAASAHWNTVWKEFPRQEPALAFAAQCLKPARLFSYEIEGSSSGSRRYVVADLEGFWRRYAAMEAKHHYELIPEGQPCHLYLDLEFAVDANPDRDGDRMTRTLVMAVLAWLRDRYNLLADWSNVLLLDSSTTTKFSKHAVIHLHQCAFANNTHVGGFLFSLLHRLHQASEDEEVRAASEAWAADSLQAMIADALPPHGHPLGESSDPYLAAARSLLVLDKNGNRVPFLDLGVYTKNRNFRLFLSSKRGKQRPLERCPTSCFNPMQWITPAVGEPTGCNDADAERCLFYASLVANVPFSENLRLLTAPPTPAGGGSPASLAPGLDVHFLGSSGAKPSQQGSTREPSPYPQVDTFLLEWLHARDPRARIRRWGVFGESKVLTYDVQGYRFCENIGRSHKSNGIYLVVNLLQGTFYQKCHDPVCRQQQFRGPEWPLPVELNPFDTSDAASAADPTEGGPDGSDPDEDLLAHLAALEQRGYEPASP